METIEELLEDTEQYRDSIATVDKEGKRIWLYPRKPKGYFHNMRIIVAFIILGSFFIVPFIRINGHEFILINIFERKFILFGHIFMPQDFHLFALGLITFFVSIILFTVVYGRFFCGWACPQTLFMEMIFRKIEYFIEGDANKQRKLNNGPWNADKVTKKGLKYLIYLAVSILVAHVSMAYLVGVDTVKDLVTQPPSENLAGFTALVVFTGLYFFVFTYLREQVCIAVCPYGRLQGVLLGKDSIVVAYDFERGEPRGKLKRKKAKADNTHKLSIDDFDKPQGDCIDCGLCVQVCPTGIDIRNGTQLECVNCTACIDACDTVMDKIDKPKGLIRYSSYNMIANKAKFKFTPRIIAYTLVLLALLGVQSFLLMDRPEAEATILRVPGSLYEEQANGDITNVYTVQVANKSFEDMSVSFKLKDVNGGEIKVAGSEIIIPKEKAAAGTILITIPKKELEGLKTRITIEVWSGEKLIETVRTNFLGPV